MSVNRGKQFENVIKKAFEKVADVSIDRLHDQTTGYKGSSNICDFIVYKEPNEYYVECKAVHGNTLSFQNITYTQWEGLLEKSKIQGVYAGIMCWWVDKDVTKYMPIEDLYEMKSWGLKSVRFDMLCGWTIKSKKKQVFFDYDMEAFFNEIQPY